MQYHKATDAEDVWEVYWYEKNLQGDIIAVYSSNATKLVSYSYDAWGYFKTTYHNGGASTQAAKNPFRYRGYYYDLDLGLYYLNSRYYDCNTGRFINADKFVSTGQGFTGYNMFAYCNNNPISFVDRSGKNAEAVQWWTSTMWWLCGADSALPVGDIIYGVGILILGVFALTVVDEVTMPQISLEEEKEEAEPVPPDVTYPGDDPTKAPDGTEWKGKGEQGSKEGNYHNPKTDESWHPDLDHSEPIGPHWDYRDPFGRWWRVGPDNNITLK